MNNKKTSYKLLSLDLDGTLLSPVLRRAKNADCRAIQRYMDAGGMAFINTGRAPWAIVNTIQRINRAGKNRVRLISCWNGAYIHDFNDGEVVLNKISHEYCKMIFSIVKKHHGAITWFATPKGMKNHTIYVYPMDPIIKIGYHLSHLSKVKDTTDLTSFKIDIISVSKNVIAKIYHELLSNNLQHAVTISHSSPRLIEITPARVNKGFSVNYFAKKYNIAKSEIMSMGDSFNDLSAFENSAVSIGISPKNLNLLAHCNEVVDHKSKGVKEAIDTYVIKQVNPQAYKLIFSDLDGTLLDAKTKLFSTHTKMALQQCTNHLIPIAIASGRAIHDEIKIVNSMELNPKTNIYVIGNNGATIFDLYTQKYISQSPIEDSDARKIFKILVNFANKAKGNLGFIIYQHSSDLIFYNQEFWRAFNFKKTGFEDRYDPWANDSPIYVTEYPNDIICYKFVVKFANGKDATKGCAELRKMFPNLEVCLSSDVNCEINRKGISKGFAAKKLCSAIGINMNNVLVLGDGQNDIEALKLTKHSFVPSYAPASVKKIAKHIIKNVTVANFASTVIDQKVLKKGVVKK